MSEPAGYPQRVRELVLRPPHGGSLAACEGRRCSGEAAALERGAWVRFEACVRGGRVEQVRFLAWGCPYVIAAAGLAAAAMEGVQAAQCPTVSAMALAADLAAPADRLGRLLVVEDACGLLTAEIRASG